MIYLISQMVFALVVAIVLGAALGWLMHRAAQAQETRRFNQQVAKYKSLLNQARSENDLIVDDYQELEQRTQDQIAALQEQVQHIPELVSNLERAQLLVSQNMKKHESRERDLSTEIHRLHEELADYKTQGHGERRETATARQSRTDTPDRKSEANEKKTTGNVEKKTPLKTASSSKSANEAPQQQNDLTQLLPSRVQLELLNTTPRNLRAAEAAKARNSENADAAQAANKDPVDNTRPTDPRPADIPRPRDPRPVDAGGSGNPVTANNTGTRRGSRATEDAGPAGKPENNDASRPASSSSREAAARSGIPPGAGPAGAELDADPFDYVMEIDDDLQLDLNNPDLITQAEPYSSTESLTSLELPKPVKASSRNKGSARSASSTAEESPGNTSSASAETVDTAAASTLFEPVDRHDDLKQIFGIGPMTEKALNELGITSYSQLADLKEHDIQRIADALNIGANRIERDNWVGNARQQLEDVLQQL